MQPNSRMSHLLAQTGRLGEQLAADHYRADGYAIIQQNYRTRQGEVDIIAQKGEILVFAEVKTRQKNPMVTGAEAVDIHKQRKIIAAALHYIAAACKQEPYIRFDVVEVLLGKNKNHIRVIENAFTAG